MSFWWGELACDFAAARASGRTAVADMWREDLERERARSLLPRIWVTTRSLRTHPPTCGPNTSPCRRTQPETAPAAHGAGQMIPDA